MVYICEQMGKLNKDQSDYQNQIHYWGYKKHLYIK